MIRKYITNLNDNVSNKPIDCYNCYCDEIINITEDEILYYTQKNNPIDDVKENKIARSMINTNHSFPCKIHHSIEYKISSKSIANNTMIMSIDNVDCEDDADTITLDFNGIQFKENSFLYIILTNIKCVVYIKNCEKLSFDIYKCKKVIFENCNSYHVSTGVFDNKIYLSDVEYKNCNISSDNKLQKNIYIDRTQITIEHETGGNNLYLTHDINNKYQQVEYIESTGTQYIDTGYIPNQDTTVKVDFEFTDVSVNSILFGVYSRTVGVSSYAFGYLIFNETTAEDLGVPSSWSVRYNDEDSSYLCCVQPDTNRHILNHCVKYNDYLEKDFYNFLLDDRRIHSCDYPSGNNNFIYNFEIFASYHETKGAGYNPCSAKLYSFKIYEGEELVRDFVPCYRKADNVIGLYDLVEDKFYTNQGTGTFLKGGDCFGKSMITVDTEAEKKLFINGEQYEKKETFDWVQIVNVNKARGFDNVISSNDFEELIRGLKYKYGKYNYNQNDFSHFASTIYNLDCFTEEEKEAIKNGFGDILKLSFQTITSTQTIDLKKDDVLLKDGMKFVLDCIATKSDQIERIQIPCVIQKNAEKTSYKLYNTTGVDYIHSFKCIFSISEYERDKDIEPITKLIDKSAVDENNKLVEAKFKTSNNFKFEDGHVYCLSGTFNIESNIDQINFQVGLYNGSNESLLKNILIKDLSTNKKVIVNGFFKYTNSAYNTETNNLPEMKEGDSSYLVFKSNISIKLIDAYLYDITRSLGDFDSDNIFTETTHTYFYRKENVLGLYDNVLKFSNNYNIMKHFWIFKATEGKIVKNINLIADIDIDIPIQYIKDNETTFNDIITWDDLKTIQGKNILIIGEKEQSLSEYPFYMSDKNIYFKDEIEELGVYGKYPIITYKEEVEE